MTLGYIVYDRKDKRLTLVNHNTQLKTKVLLLGYTNKRGHHEIIGQFGEYIVHVAGVWFIHNQFFFRSASDKNLIQPEILITDFFGSIKLQS